MNKALAFVTILGLAVTGCGKKSGDSAAGGSTGAAKTAEPAGDTPKAPQLAVNEADWAVKDLHTVSPMVNISMKVPKDAKLEKNGNGGVDITLADFYVITVSQLADSNIAEAKKDTLALTVNNASSYINGKVLTDEPNGAVYTMQMKDEANGTKYQPETHFAVYLDKDGAIYSVQDARSMNGFSTPGSAFSEDVARKIYAIVKGSAKVNP